MAGPGSFYRIHLKFNMDRPWGQKYIGEENIPTPTKPTQNPVRIGDFSSKNP